MCALVLLFAFIMSLVLNVVEKMFHHEANKASKESNKTEALAVEKSS